jgi:hypothetical protein
VIKIKEDEMGRLCSTHGRDEKSIQYFEWQTERKSPLGRPRRRWENNIRIDLTELRWEDVDWIHVSQDRDQWRVLVNAVVKFCVS